MSYVTVRMCLCMLMCVVHCTLIQLEFGIQLQFTNTHKTARNRHQVAMLGILYMDDGYALAKFGMRYVPNLLLCLFLGHST